MSAHQLGRMLGLPYKTAGSWHTVSANYSAKLSPKRPIGGKGQTVEADETYVGGKEKNKHRNTESRKIGGMGKEAVFSLVERGGGSARIMSECDCGATLKPISAAQLDQASSLMTDDEASTVNSAPCLLDMGRSITGSTNMFAATPIRTPSKAILDP